MLEWITMPEAWIALATLTALEIVLGIDNIIFLSILVDRLPEKQRPKARLIGLSLAMVMRLGLLASLAWLTKLTADLFMVLGQGISGRDLVLILGGLFFRKLLRSKACRKQPAQQQQSRLANLILPA